MQSAPRPKVIALVPVKNEAWILRHFVACASLWADRIIIADQMSDDRSRDMVAAHPKVIVIDNCSDRYSEGERQQLLIEAARTIPGPRLLVALDADEMLSANVLSSPEWRAATHTPPGTVLALSKVDLYGSPEQYCLHSAEDRNVWMPFAYVDDDAPYCGEVLHSPRVPVPPTARWMRLNDVVVLHYNHVNLPRLASKNRWYRCFERVTFPARSVLDIERRYGWLARGAAELKIRPSRPEWLAAYRQAGIDVGAIHDAGVWWWDWEVLRMFAQHGTAPFRHLDIWSVDWEALRAAGKRQGVPGLPDEPLDEPRRRRDRWLRRAVAQSHRLRPRRLVDWSVARLCERL